MIGMDHPTYFIAEIGANFDGNLDKAKRLIDAAKEAGVLNFKHSQLLALCQREDFLVCN